MGHASAAHEVREAGGLSGDIAVAVARGVAAQYARVRQVVALGASSGAAGPGAGELAALALAVDPTISLVDEPVAGTLPNAELIGPAMAVFFVLFVVGAPDRRACCGSARRAASPAWRPRRSRGHRSSSALRCRCSP